MRTYFIRWYLTAEWAPSAPIMRSKSIWISFARPVSFPLPWTSNHALHERKSAPVNLWLKKILTFGMLSRISRSLALRPALSIAKIVCESQS